jgi:hypothetical protein
MFMETMKDVKPNVMGYFLRTVELVVEVTPWEVYFPRLVESELLQAILKSVVDPEVVSRGNALMVGGLYCRSAVNEHHR